MRIGIDARLWNETGVGRYIRNLVNNLAAIDKENEYILFGKNDVIGNGKFKIVETDIRWHSIDEQLRLASILNKEKLDLMHFPYFSVPVAYNKPFVVTIHDLIINQVDTGKASTLPLPLYKAKRLGYKLVLRSTVNKAAKIIAVSQATKADIIKYLGVKPDKIAVTYEGVDDAINSKRQIKNQKHFLYVGNAYPHKNLERLVDAFASVDAKLILVGKSDYFYKKLKNYVVEKELSEKIIFYGQVTDEELSGLYQNARALVMPSLIEGFGLPALEAMANNCLVLASDIPSLREVCKEAAIYFNPYDVSDIAEKFEKVFRSRSLVYDTKKREGLVRVKKFSWEKMAKETLKIYEEVASS